jgi:predicted HTH transcriptional regulator
MVFADRIEVWNPGGLPEDLTVDQLHGPHPSVPRNRLLCEPLFLAHYIERAGTGTLDMIRLCAESGLPEPEFLNEGERFRLIIWRDWLTESVLSALDVSDRQKRAVEFTKEHGTITNSKYQRLVGIAKRTAHRDLTDLVAKGIFEKVGTTGKGTYYIIAKGAIKGPNGL